MIRSRTLTEDRYVCARCKHLRYSAPSYCCGIDGEKVPDPGLIVMTTCERFIPNLKGSEDAWQDMISSKSPENPSKNITGD